MAALASAEKGLRSPSDVCHRFGQEKGLGKLEVFYQGAKLPSHNGITLLPGGIWRLIDAGHDVSLQLAEPLFL